MADNKRDIERAELHRTIWNIANDLRGSVDGWDFKQYVLGMLFYRYISENLTNYINKGEWEAGNTDFDYAELSDEEAIEIKDDMVQTKGFFILPSELFQNVRKNAAKDKNLNETLERVFKNIEASTIGAKSEKNFKGLFDDIDVNSNKLGNTVEERNKKLVKILNAIGDMQLGDVKNNSIDAFGDAYEFLMTMYASNAGKSGGEFFTPQEVSELLARITVVGKEDVNKVYDPACGSGSLLLQFAKVLGKDKVRIGFFGQEVNITTYNLCRINMWLHDIDYTKFDIALGDTLIEPKHWDDEPFEAIVSNPPYSIKWEGNDNPLLINDPRFAPAGVLAPKSKADLAFIMHCLSWLAPNGTAAIVCFPGVLYRGGAEQKIRKYLVDNNYIDAIIQLPENLFFGTPIATCIMVLKRSKSDNNILFIDASKEFIKVTNNNKLTSENIQNILNAYIERKDIDHFAKLASREEVEEFDYNLSVTAYVEPEDTREEIDIVKLNAEIEKIVARQQVLREEIDKIINMSRLNQLIQELCPDGVEYRRLKDVCTFKRGTSITKKDIVEGDIPVIAGGQEPAYYHNQANRTGETVVISSSGAYAGFVSYWEQPIFVSDAFSVEPNGKILTKYLYYFLKSKQDKIYSLQKAGGVPHVYSTDIAPLKIPLPPLPVQQEIVRILDALSKATTELNKELNIELEARKKQYEYYRNKLLSFGNEVE